jgi:hypothetical protein
VQAVLGARTEFLTETFVDGATDIELCSALTRFYAECVQPPLHEASLRRRAGNVRHALGHLLRCPDPLPRKIRRCLAVDGPYHVEALGPAFWSAVFQALDPVRQPAWSAGVLAGLERLEIAELPDRGNPAGAYAALGSVYARLRSLEPALGALQLDHFLTLVAAMQGRDLWSGAELLADTQAAAELRKALQRMRLRVPLRERIKTGGRAFHEARGRLRDGLAARDAGKVVAALEAIDPEGAQLAGPGWRERGENLLLWAGRLWEATDPWAVLQAYWAADSLPGGGLWLPAAVLHCREATQFPLWNDLVRRGYQRLDEAALNRMALVQQYRLFAEGIAALRERFQLHVLEVGPALADLAAQSRTADQLPALRAGFCPDSFRFLAELAENNDRAWMHANRERYRFAVREPLVELCRLLAERYVVPTLRGRHGWNLDVTPRSGRALTSVCKNDYGRSVPYNTALWIVFSSREGSGRAGMQFFVRLDSAGLRFGIRLGDGAGGTGDRLRRHVEEHGPLLQRALRRMGALADCNFGAGERVADAEGLRRWAAGKSLEAGKHLPADASLGSLDELAGTILLTFDQLVPLFACAVESDPRPLLTARAGQTAEGPAFTATDFCRETYLGEDWLERAQALLRLKRQLILQGVPGTGKTHVARCLAHLLASGRDEAVRLVQFHPAYSYEEFVEGIKVRSVEVNGKQEVAYPVEEGVLGAFASVAAGRPGQAHVLIIDEINRGNLPRIFGELLYLLEYRGQSVVLPYSRREFQLPANLYLLGTMNAADRSVALVDQALRRRFSFLDMAPDPAVLAAWLREHPPLDGERFADTVLGLFERLNTRLRGDLGAQAQVGHSYFMVPDLDEQRLRVVWQHQVLPLVEDQFAGHPGRTQGYDLDSLMHGKRKERSRRPTQAAGARG